MNQEQIVIRSEVDIISARMAVREFARHCGLGLTEQSCISLAAASVAHSMGLGRESNSGGVMVIEYFENGHHQGVRVKCIKHEAAEGDGDAVNHLGNSRFLVDDVELKMGSSEGIEIAVTKWNASRKG
jgi:hypothetical protein